MILKFKQFESKLAKAVNLNSYALIYNEKTTEGKNKVYSITCNGIEHYLLYIHVHDTQHYYCILNFGYTFKNLTEIDIKNLINKYDISYTYDENYSLAKNFMNFLCYTNFRSNQLLIEDNVIDKSKKIADFLDVDIAIINAILYSNENSNESRLSKAVSVNNFELIYYDNTNIMGEVYIWLILANGVEHYLYYNFTKPDKQVVAIRSSFGNLGFSYLKNKDLQQPSAEVKRVWKQYDIDYYENKPLSYNFYNFLDINITWNNIGSKSFNINDKDIANKVSMYLDIPQNTIEQIFSTPPKQLNESKLTKATSYADRPYTTVYESPLACVYVIHNYNEDLYFFIASDRTVYRFNNLPRYKDIDETNLKYIMSLYNLEYDSTSSVNRNIHNLLNEGKFDKTDHLSIKETDLQYSLLLDTQELIEKIAKDFKTDKYIINEIYTKWLNRKKI